ncbi:hypothetical protein, partial [Clostridioides difficile]|uniref:hypothetical protein n=1 Tax=Clostridioides difficile TaxID=1496 RepID=UPI001A930376
NNVVCKGIFVSIKTASIMTNFILTMWYVKHISYHFYSTRPHHFILTMWYVNSIALTLNSFTASPFYIN